MIMTTIASTLLFSFMLLWAPAATAEPGRGAAGTTTEPKRSYSSIDVIMYQTSW